MVRIKYITESIISMSYLNFTPMNTNMIFLGVVTNKFFVRKVKQKCNSIYAFIQRPKIF